MQDQILETLTQTVRMEAVLSLEPILMLIGALARDLQADFLPYLPQIFTCFSDLVDEGLPLHKVTVAIYNSAFKVISQPGDGSKL